MSWLVARPEPGFFQTSTEVGATAFAGSHAAGDAAALRRRRVWRFCAVGVIRHAGANGQEATS
jgi:hypothetical protein